MYMSEVNIHIAAVHICWSCTYMLELYMLELYMLELYMLELYMLELYAHDIWFILYSFVGVVVELLCCHMFCSLPQWQSVQF